MVNVGTADNITFHCTDSGVGVDINTVTAQVDGVVYTATGANQFTYSGSPADYFITVDPVSNFAIDHAWEVVVNARDFSNNATDQVAFGLASGVNGTCPICQPCQTCQTCEKCESCDDKKETVTKYKECTVVNKIMGTNTITKWLPAKTKISRAQLDNISLNEINNVDIHIGNQPVGNLATAIVNGERQVLVTVNEDKVIFEGTSLPNVQVTLMIESEPIIVTGLADDSGHWKIETANIFTNGIHKVSAVTLSEDNYVVKTKELAKFRVFRTKFSWWCWVIIAILLILLIGVYKKYRKYKNKYCKLKPTDCLKKKKRVIKKLSKKVISRKKFKKRKGKK